MKNDISLDLQLFDRWCTGDAGAGLRLVRRHYAAVYRFFETKRVGDVEDAVHDTFLACQRKRDQFRRESDFRAFLFGIARYTLLEHWRQLRRERNQVDVDAVPIMALTSSVRTRLARTADHRRLLEALLQLPVEQQVLLALRYWEQLDSTDMATILDVDPVTIRTRLYRAREALRALMQSSARTDLNISAEADFEAWAQCLPLPTDMGSRQETRRDEPPAQSGISRRRRADAARSA